MHNKRLNQVIRQLENHLECWKLLNHYIGLGRTKRFDAEDENQFLEIKSVLTQELEIILAAVECASPSKEEVHALIGGIPSIRFLSELTEDSLRSVENQWHKVYISWQSLLGQLKVQQRKLENETFIGSIFRKQ